MGDLRHVANAILIVILCTDFSTIRTALGSCIFDKIKLAKPQSITLHYENDTHVASEGRHKRASLSSLYQPIRIAVEYSNLDDELTISEQEGLRRLVDNMVRKVTNIFSVVPVQGKLLLRRASDGCLVVWQTGPNMGKCSLAKRGYKKEICIDDFQIPNRHLSGVSLWNATDPEPVDVLIEDGEGLPDTDYVLYVQSRTADLCINQGYNVIAYAAYCQVDQHGRPIAGYINFCPELLRDDQKEIDEVTALHEMFHALGFSKDLFDKFQECTPTGTNGLTCTTRKRSVRTIGGVPRLVTPRLVEVTSRHFNCTTHADINEFGPILQTENGIYQSHWDPAFMQTSLMTPTIGLPHLTFIDEITLSLFEDSGWYRVNYDYAQQFLWGKGGGCDFGTAPACENESDLFCTGEAKKCHYLHKDKATCKTNSFLHGCRIFQVKDIEDSCQYQPPGGRPSGVEFYGEDGRCFVSNLTEVTTAMLDTASTEMTGRCYQHHCTNNHLLVQVRHSPWLNCPSGTLIQVPGYGGVLQCPDANVVCGASVTVHTTTTIPPRGTKTTAPRKTTTHTPEFNADHSTASPTEASENRTCLEITFASSDNPVLYTDNTGAFHGAVVDAILLLSGVRHCRLDDAQVINSTDVVYYIEMRQRYNASDGPTNEEVFKRLESAVNDGRMTVTLTEDGNTYVASSIGHSPGKCEVSTHKRYTGIIIGAALGSLASMAVIGVLVGLLIVSLRRRYIAQTAPSSQTGGDT